MNDMWSEPPCACPPGTGVSTCSLISVGTAAIHWGMWFGASANPWPSSSTMRQVPLSWLKAACMPSITSGWSSLKDAEPIRPISSAPQWPTRMVRRGLG
jgi:hypothetical protein